MVRDPTMGINIKNPKVEQDIRTLAARTGQSLTAAVATAVREKLSRTPLSKREKAQRMRVLRQIQRRIAKAPRLNDDLTDDEILGYNEHGHFD
jgi:antitoxin VapB